MTHYLARKSLLYLLTFWFAVTIDWLIPRLMPGDPIDGLIGRIQADSTASQELHGYFTESFELDQPLWRQYLNFWRGLVQGDLGPSITYVGSTVSELIWAAIPYTLALLIPAIVLSYIAGNRVGAMAARRKSLDNTVLPAAYVLTATPYMWLASRERERNRDRGLHEAAQQPRPCLQPTAVHHTVHAGRGHGVADIHQRHDQGHDGVFLGGQRAGEHQVRDREAHAGDPQHRGAAERGRAPQRPHACSRRTRDSIVV